MNKRIWELDVFRGICILGVVAVHAVYDLVELYHIIDWQYPAWFSLIKNWGGLLFVVLSGICVTLGSRSVRRGIIVLLCGMVITAVTYGMYHFEISGKGILIYFGVLHCLGTCMILWPVFKQCPWWILLLLGGSCDAMSKVYERLGAQAMALVTLALCDRFAETKRQGAGKILFAALCCVLLFLLGMDNYITAMMTAASLMMMALWRLWAAKKTPAGAVTGVQMGEDWQEHHYGGEADAAHERLAGLRTAKLLIPIGIGLLISVLAPGNAVRMAADGAHESGIVYLGLSIVRTLTAAGGYFGRFLFRTPMALLLTAMTPMLCRALREVPVRRSYRMPAIPVILLGAYLILCAMIIPHMYASGNAGSGRVVNMYHCYVALASVLCWVLCLMRLAPETRTYLCGPVWKLRGAALIVLFALVCVWGGQHGSYVKLVRDQRDGTQDAYIAQIKNEYALCEAAGPEDDVILPVWTVQTMTGKITATEDPLLWTNEAMAQYFGVKSVKAE